jgi:ParB-like chromosome segregation protein Spo0J
MKAHIYKSQLKKILLSKFKNVENFNPNRLQDSAIKAYPISDRPLGAADINSVKYYQRLIKKNKVITPIWLLLKNNKYILLDGAHRIVASYIELQKYINCYVIEL